MGVYGRVSRGGAATQTRTMTFHIVIIAFVCTHIYTCVCVLVHYNNDKLPRPTECVCVCVHGGNMCTALDFSSTPAFVYIILYKFIAYYIIYTTSTMSQCVLPASVCVRPSAWTPKKEQKNVNARAKLVSLSLFLSPFTRSRWPVRFIHSRPFEANTYDT